MPSFMARGAQAYYQTQVQSSSPLELVVMLYDGALRFIGQAREALDRRDLVAKREAMSRALAIIGELQGSLDMETGGEIARSLDGLYAYVTGRLVQANADVDPAGLDECIRLLTPLREAWAQIAIPPPPAA